MHPQLLPGQPEGYGGGVKGPVPPGPGEAAGRGIAQQLQQTCPLWAHEPGAEEPSVLGRVCLCIYQAAAWENSSSLGGAAAHPVCQPVDVPAAAVGVWGRCRAHRGHQPSPTLDLLPCISVSSQNLKLFVTGVSPAHRSAPWEARLALESQDGAWGCLPPRRAGHRVSGQRGISTAPGARGNGKKGTRPPEIAPR